VVCLENNKTHAIAPCMHLCLCQDCAADLIVKRGCPICTQPANQILRIYDC